MTLAPLLNLVFLGVTTQLTIPHTAYSFEGIGLSDHIHEILDRLLESITEVMRKGLCESEVHTNLAVDAAAFALLGMIQRTATIWTPNGYSRSLNRSHRQILEIYKNSLSASVQVPA